MNTYKMATRETRNGTQAAKLSGFEMPWAAIVQESETHVTIKVPGHSSWVGYGLGNAANTAYTPAEFQVFEKLFGENINLDSPHHNVKRIVSFPVRQSKD